jgi:hypothetical protein
MKKAFNFLLFLSFIFSSSNLLSQTNAYDVVRGSWEVSGSRDVKTFGDDGIEFKKLEAKCYLKSTWTFATDSTGYITVKKSSKCGDPAQMNFSYKLFESPGYGGPIYKMDIRFEDGTPEKLSLIPEKGNKEMKIGYHDPLRRNRAVNGTNEGVWIYFSTKKNK